MKGMDCKKLLPVILAFSPLLTHAAEIMMNQDPTRPFIEKQMGTIGFDSTSFLYKENGRGTNYTALEATLQGKYDNSFMHAQGDGQFYTFMNEKPLVGFESKELYLSTQDGLIGDGKLIVGRKYYEWSKVDQTWDQMSLWSPRWTWDQLHPETIGMTGAFITYDTNHFHFVAFGSPIAIPERGTPTYQENNNIVSQNPFWQPLPSTLNVMNTQTPVLYSLKTPSMSEILLRPNFAVKAKLESDAGYWTSIGAGVLPVNQIQMAAEPFLAANNNANLTVNIIPEFPMRQILTGEAGYASPSKDWDLWLSGSHERPFNFENQPTWLNPIITPATVVSAGTDVQLTSNFWFNGSVLFVHEDPFVSASTLQNVNVQLPSRFPLKQGIKVGGDWRFNDQTQTKMSWTQDLIQQNHMISLDLEHSFRHFPVMVGAGADIMIQNSTEGWVGQYYGDDRVRGWLKYAF